MPILARNVSGRTTGWAALVVGAMALCATTTVWAVGFGNGVYWTHNGSWMTISRNGRNISIRYDEPRSGLSVGPGTRLFRGTISGNSIRGTAYTFKRGCDPAPYRVSGRLTDRGGVGSIVLRGAAPVRRNGCGVQRYSNNSSNAQLVFRYAGTGD